ncbi:BLUF domain-containing protein [Aquimarina sp. MMG016]|uniref:BLUF domain-containing protein n=1 Tax=Aquimarina sp. MMG016 TaxID=2822690 RepID=UPI001B3A3BC5|nr:BLUF domain-containing protein [Aquimarina sp. MMG016]MBQ4822451.1 BLUF domain-containing protein [Aquimarina sp. MMG016]
MLLTICYISNASEKLKSEDIEMLMVETKAFNNANNIGGILIYSDLTFFQIIEGEYDLIKSLFKKIEQDYRHYNVLKILETKSTKMRYERFNSKYITYHREEANIELQKFLEIDDNNMSDHELHNLVVYQSKVLSNIY